MSLNLKRMDVSFEMKASDDATGEFSGYGAVFGNIDLGRDVIQPGAFKDSLKAWSKKKALPSMLWHHQASEPIGTWKSMSEDETGLYVEGKVLTEAGELEKRIYAHLKSGSVRGLSIGYRIPKGGGEYDPKADVFKLHKLDLFEVSVVPIPMNEEALIDAVKSAIDSPKEFERLLRDAGLSRSQAKALMGGGYKALVSQRDADGEEAEQVKAAIEALTQKFQVA